VSLLQNGNDLTNQTYIFSIEDQSHIGEVRRFSAGISTQLNFSDVRHGRVAIIVTELCTNLLKYSPGGQIFVRTFDQLGNRGIEFLSVDSGLGIQNLDLAMTDGFSTGSSPGNGLGAIKRQSDEFDIYSQYGLGTIILSAIYDSDNFEKKEIDIGAINFPVKGEQICGDAWSVSLNGNDLNIIVTDGLGHGPAAHKASEEALQEFKNFNNLPVEAGLNNIHGRLRGTRGAAVAVSRWREQKNIEYVAVGNITGVILTKESKKTLMTQNGTAGLRIPRLRTYEQSWGGDGVLIFHSDGIKTQWNLDRYPDILKRHPAIIAAVIFKDFRRHNDDATILVIGRKS
jgi:anti-sigma regulatory factor (Ser/Thr protein kinase)